MSSFLPLSSALPLPQPALGPAVLPGGGPPAGLVAHGLPAGVVAGPPGYTGVGPGPGHGQAVAAFEHALHAARLGDRSPVASAALLAAHHAGIIPPLHPALVADLEQQFNPQPFRALRGVLSG